MNSYQLTVYNVKINQCDNSFMTEQRQSIIVGAKQRSALANYIRPKQRLSTSTVKGREKRKNIENSVTFVTFVTLHSLTYLLINLFTLKIK